MQAEGKMQTTVIICMYNVLCCFHCWGLTINMIIQANCRESALRLDRIVLCETEYHSS